MNEEQETTGDLPTIPTIEAKPKSRSRSKKTTADPQPAGRTPSQRGGPPASGADPQPDVRPRSAKLSHRGQGTLVVTGISGKVYRFTGHGAVQKVAGGDVEKLLALSRENRGCCGAKAVQRQRLLVTVR